MTMRLPQLPARVAKDMSEPIGLQGINYSQNYRDGDLSESTNLSTRQFPAIATRTRREWIDWYTDVTALGAWEAMVVVAGNTLYYGNQAVGEITPGEKQMAVVNTKLVIWPDKVYLDLDDRTIKPLEAVLSGTGAVFSTDTITVTGWDSALTDGLKIGDTIEISGCAESANNGYFAIRELTATTLKTDADNFTEATEAGEITIARRLPNLDYICESANRLWGCDSESRSIYGSSLGDPTNFYTYQGLSTDAYAVAVGDEGVFTGCARLSGSVLFWKERKLYKLLGSTPSEYSLVAYDIEGVMDGCHKSQRIINDVLYFMGVHGVYRYNGGTPQLISAVFGEKSFSYARAGTEGEKYYLSVLDGSTPRLMVYDSRYNLWLREDDTRVVDFALLNGRLYYCDDAGRVWRADSGEDDSDILWEAKFAPMYETMEGRKHYRKLLIRARVPNGAWMEAECSFNGKPWITVGRVIGADVDVKSIVIPIARVDKIELKLRGKGPAAILGLVREFSVGSDRS